MICNTLDEVRANIDRIYTTPLGAERIARNLALPAGTDSVAYCIQKNTIALVPHHPQRQKFLLRC